MKSFLLKLIRNKIVIDCPACHNKQAFTYNQDAHLHLPIRPYCCAVMEYEDTTQWYKQLDAEIAKQAN